MWEGRDLNALADSTAKQAALHGISLFRDEFSSRGLPQKYLEVMLSDQVVVGL